MVEVKEEHSPLLLSVLVILFLDTIRFCFGSALVLGMFGCVWIRLDTRFGYVWMFFEWKSLRLTHSFFQGGWHFPENPKIDGDTDPFLKSGKILNHRVAPARICNSKI